MLSMSLGILSKSELRLGKGTFDMAKRCIMKINIYVLKMKVWKRVEKG